MRMGTIRWSNTACLCVVVLATISIVRAQQVVRINDANAINPAEVSIAINPANPDNMIAASLQIG